MFWNFEYGGELLEEDVIQSKQLGEMQDLRIRQMIANRLEDGTITLA
jgi:hypothetical protein